MQLPLNQSSQPFTKNCSTPGVGKHWSAVHFQRGSVPPRLQRFEALQRQKQGAEQLDRLRPPQLPDGLPLPAARPRFASFCPHPLHQFNSCNRRATSSALARLLKAEMRKNPSPFEPKPLPGVITTFESCRILSNACQLVTPFGVRTQM